MSSTGGIISKLMGKWQQVSSDNFDAFLSAAGITGERAEKARGAQVPELWSIEADNITASRVFPDKTLSVTFKLNEDFLDPTIGDGKYMSKFTIEDGKLVRRGSTNQQGVTAIREVKGNVQIMTMICNGVTCTKTFNRI